MNDRLRKKAPGNIQYDKVISCVFLFTLTSAIVWRLTHLQITDYSVHLSSAVNLFSPGTTVEIDRLWHFCVWCVYKLLGSGDLDIHIACCFVSAAVTVIVYLITDGVLKSKVKNSAAVSLALGITSAIFLPGYNPRIYYGQGSPVTWHNPTNLMVKPFAIGVFFLVVRMIEHILRGEEPDRKEYAALCCFAAVSVLAKPSFFQGFVPALGIFILLRLIRDRFRTFKSYFRICAMFIPAAAAVALQFVLSFYVGEGEGIGFGWLTVNASPNTVISLLLVLAFPLSYLLIYGKSAMKNVEIQLAWLFWLVSWLEKAILYEKGAHMYDSNFGWASLLAYSLLYIVTAGEYFAEMQSGKNQRNRIIRNIPGAVFALHLISGWIYAFEMLVGYNGYVY